MIILGVFLLGTVIGSISALTIVTYLLKLKKSLKELEKQFDHLINLVADTRHRYIPTIY